LSLSCHYDCCHFIIRTFFCCAKLLLPISSFLFFFVGIKIKRIQDNVYYSFVTTDNHGNFIHTISQCMYILSELLRMTIRARRSTKKNLTENEKNKHFSNRSQRQRILNLSCKLKKMFFWDGHKRERI
jgi:hypothetical protein